MTKRFEYPCAACADIAAGFDRLLGVIAASGGSTRTNTPLVQPRPRRST